MSKIRGYSLALSLFTTRTTVQSISIPASQYARVTVKNRGAFLLTGVEVVLASIEPVQPFAQSVEIEGLYRRAGASVTLRAIEAPNSHAFWNETRYFPETMGLAVEFFRRTLIKAK